MGCVSKTQLQEDENLNLLPRRLEDQHKQSLFSDLPKTRYGVLFPSANVMSNMGYDVQWKIFLPITFQAAGSVTSVTVYFGRPYGIAVQLWRSAAMMKNGSTGSGSAGNEYTLVYESMPVAASGFYQVRWPQVKAVDLIYQVLHLIVLFLC